MQSLNYSKINLCNFVGPVIELTVHFEDKTNGGTMKVIYSFASVWPFVYVQKELLCEDLNHTSEQLSKLTEASKKHAALLQCAQEDLIRKEVIIQELQEQVNLGEG